MGIRSIQNQRMKDIEILIIDDNSKDNTLKIIDKSRVKDKRIKLIRNYKNRGALFSKSLGILKAKGKYIIFLDGDDFFINEDLFNKCFYEAIKSHIDIIEFSGLFLENDKFELNGKFPKIPLYFRFKKDNDFVKQPQLSRFLYRSLEHNKYKLIDGFLTGKCIKSNILQKTIKMIGKEIYSQKLNYGDDRLINYLLFKKANSFKFIKKYGYIYNYNNASITHINKTINNCHDELINIAHIYKYSQFTNESEIVSYELFHRFKNIIKPGLNNKNLKYLNELIKIMIKNKYLSNNNKIKLINILNL